MTMKKVFLFASIIATLMLSSCQQDELPVDKMDSNVVFTVDLPGMNMTKGTIDSGATIADGTNVNYLHYAIYMTKVGTEHSVVGDNTSPLFQGVVGLDFDQVNRKRSATIDFNLVKNQDYTIIFWAQVSSDQSGMNAHYDLSDLRIVSMTAGAVVDADANANDESRAAFYAKYEFNTADQKKHEVTLTRPFSQLNLLTTPQSLVLSQPGQTTGSYVIDIKQSMMTVKGVATKFDTREGMAVESSTGTYKFALADTPEEQGQKTLRVGSDDYHYVSMNYFFVPFNEVTDVEVDYSIVTALGSRIENDVINVPIRKNHRTNLIGNLLTKETTFEIVVDSTFFEPSKDTLLTKIAHIN